MKGQRSTKDTFSVLFQQSKHWLNILLEKFLSCFKAQYAVSAVGALLGLASAEQMRGVSCLFFVSQHSMHGCNAKGEMVIVK